MQRSWVLSLVKLPLSKCNLFCSHFNICIVLLQSHSSLYLQRSLPLWNTVHFLHWYVSTILDPSRGDVTVTDSSLADIPLTWWAVKLICVHVIYFANLPDADTTLTYSIFMNEAAEKGISVSASIHQAANGFNNIQYILWALLSLPTQCFAAARQGSRTNVVMSWPTPAITSVRMRGCAH